LGQRSFQTMTVEVRARWILAKSNLEVLDIRISVVGGGGREPSLSRVL
jgi:hypothetical protein